MNPGMIAPKADLMYPAYRRALRVLRKWRRDDVSMDQIGKLAGLHTSTVSNIFSGRYGMSQRTVQKILAAAQ